MMDLHSVMLLLLTTAAATRNESRRCVRWLRFVAAHRRRHHTLGSLDTSRRRRYRILQQTMRLHFHQLFVCQIKRK